MKTIIASLIVALLVTSNVQAASKDDIIETCRGIIKKQNSFHPRISNIVEVGSDKYTFDVLFIKRGKVVGERGLNYSCEYYPEEGEVYSGLSKEYLRKMQAKRQAERVIEEKANAERRAERAIVEKAIAEKRRVAKELADKVAKVERERVELVKSKGDSYAKQCHAKMKTRMRLGGYIFKDNYNSIMISLGSYKGKCSLNGKTEEELLPYDDGLWNVKWIRLAQ